MSGKPVELGDLCAGFVWLRAMDCFCDLSHIQLNPFFVTPERLSYGVTTIEIDGCTMNLLDRDRLIRIRKGGLFLFVLSGFESRATIYAILPAPGERYPQDHLCQRQPVSPPGSLEPGSFQPGLQPAGPDFEPSSVGTRMESDPHTCRGRKGGEKQKPHNRWL